MIFLTRSPGRCTAAERTDDPHFADVMPRRRALLRGAMAAGCGLLLPAALLGCDKKDAGTGAAGEAASPGPDTTGNTSLPPTPGDSSAVGSTPSGPGTDSGTSGTPGTGSPPADTGGAGGAGPDTGPDAGTGSSGGSNATASGGGGAKASQASVQYQDQPKGAQKCANCIQFIQPDGCKVVEGRISPEGWCVIWVGQT